MADEDANVSELLEEAQAAVLRRVIAEVGRGASTLRYAEAYAWLASPDQPHGSAFGGGS